jgi:hypothetical protein
MPTLSIRTLSVACATLATFLGLGGCDGYSPPASTEVTQRSAPAEANAPSESVNVLDFGVRPDGVSDSLAGFQSALDYAAREGKPLQVPAGTYAFHGTFPPRPGLRVPTGSRIVGEGQGASTLKITGPGTFDSLLWVKDASNVTIEGLKLIGSGEGYVFPATGALDSIHSGRAISVCLPAVPPHDTDYVPPVRDMRGVQLLNNQFENFTAEGWVEIRNETDSPTHNPTGNLREITVKGNTFTSQPGNCLYPSTWGHISSAVWIAGVNFAKTDRPGLVEDVLIEDNTFNLGHIQAGVVMFTGTRNIRVLDNTILDAGRLAAGDQDITVNQYGVMAYHSQVTPTNALGRAPSQIQVRRNLIHFPEKTGVYFAGEISESVISENTLIGGSPNGDIIPTGGIGLNAVTSVDVRNNTIHPESLGVSNARYGINIAAGTQAGKVLVENNSIGQVPDEGTGINIYHLPGAQSTIVLNNNDLLTRSDTAYSAVVAYRGGLLSIRNFNQTGFVRRLSAYREVGGEWQAYQDFSDNPNFDIGVSTTDGIRYRAGPRGYRGVACEWLTQDRFWR